MRFDYEYVWPHWAQAKLSSSWAAWSERLSTDIHSFWKKIKPYFSGMKYKVFDALESHLQAAVMEGESHLSSLHDALSAEAKSTAGDKHETGRAMIHQEMRQVNETLQRSQSALDELTRLRQVSIAPVRVAAGVLVETTGPWVLVGLPFGKLSLDGGLVLGVSVEAPLAQSWHGAQVGDEVRLGPSTLQIVALH